MPFCSSRLLPCTRTLSVGADSEYELYKVISDDPVVLPDDAAISVAARELLVGNESNGWRGIVAKDPASRMTIAQIRQSNFVTRDGTEPLPPSLHVCIRISRFCMQLRAYLPDQLSGCATNLPAGCTLQTEARSGPRCYNPIAHKWVDPRVFESTPCRPARPRKGATSMLNQAVNWTQKLIASVGIVCVQAAQHSREAKTQLQRETAPDTS